MALVIRYRTPLTDVQYDVVLDTLCSKFAFYCVYLQVDWQAEVACQKVANEELPLGFCAARLTPTTILVPLYANSCSLLWCNTKAPPLPLRLGSTAVASSFLLITIGKLWRTQTSAALANQDCGKHLAWCC